MLSKMLDFCVDVGTMNVQIFTSETNEYIETINYLFSAKKFI